MSSEVFLSGNVAFLLPFLIDLLIVYLTVKKIFNLHKKFPEKTYFFNYIMTFSRSSKGPKGKYQQKCFFLINFFFKNYALRFHLGVSSLFGHTV
jgi:hypothetical protein